MSHLDPLLEEVIVATLAVTVLGAAVAVLFRLLTGVSPWPFLVLGEILGLGMGIVLLTLASPRRRP